MKISELAQQIKPYVVGWASEIQRSGAAGGSAPSPHSLSSIHHSGTLSSGQAPQFLLLDGSRPMTAGLEINSSIVEAPFVIGANGQGQLVTGLNADKTDGYDFDQALLVSSSPTFSQLSLSGIGTFAYTTDLAFSVVVPTTTGQLAKSLMDHILQSAGTHPMTESSSGYFLRVRSGGSSTIGGGIRFGQVGAGSANQGETWITAQYNNNYTSQLDFWVPKVGNGAAAAHEVIRAFSIVGDTGNTYALSSLFGNLLVKNAAATAVHYLYQNGSATFNANKQTTGDFLVSGLNDTYLIFADADNNAIGIGAVPSTIAKVLITGTADKPELSVKAFAGQTASLQDWRSSGGGVLAYVNTSGGAYFAGNIGIGVSPSAYYRQYLNWSLTADPGVAPVGLYASLNVSIPAGFSRYSTGLVGYANNAAGSGNITGGLTGLTGYVRNSSTGTNVNSLTGLSGSVDLQGSTTGTTGYAISAALSGLGSLSVGYGIYVQATMTAITTSYKGIYIASPSTATPVTHIGIQLENVDKGSSVNWAIYTGLGDVSFGDDLQFRQASTVSTTAGNLTIAPAGDIEFNPTGNDILPTIGYDLNLGSLAKKYLTLHAAELWVETLVAQNTIATIGGRILVGPTTVLTADLAAAGTSIVVKHNDLATGDTVYLEANGQVEFIAITGGPTGTGPYTYAVTRNLDGSGANDWYAGDAVFNTGATGDGFIDLYSVRGVKTATEYGPTIVGNVRQSATYNDWEPRWAIGNLNGVYGVGVTTYGVAFGDPNEVHIRIDDSSGLKIYDGAAIKIDLQTDGDVFIGSDTTSPTSTYLAIFSQAQTYNSESVSAGDMLIGDNSTGKANVLWDKSAGKLLFRGGTTAAAYINTDGAVMAGNGKVWLDGDGIGLDYTAGATQAAINWYSGGVVNAFVLGLALDGVRGLQLGAQRIEFFDGSNINFAFTPTEFSSKLPIKIGLDGSSGGLYIGSTYDTQIYRSAANTLRTPDSLIIDAGLIIGLTSAPGAGNIGFSGDLKPFRNSTYYTAYSFVPLETPLTSTSWDGDARSTTAKTLIDLSAVFGAPAGIKGVLLSISVNDSGSAGTDCWILFSPNGTAYQGLSVSCGEINDRPGRGVISVPCDGNGDIYFQTNASGAGTMDVTLQIWGYWI